jgi:hypothetical protein
MTEEDAKQKWCPFTRAMAASVSTSPNRLVDGAPHRGSMCIASACMAWRWDTDAWTLAFDDKGPLTRRKDYDEPQGYCGLASRP